MHNCYFSCTISIIHYSEVIIIKLCRHMRLFFLLILLFTLFSFQCNKENIEEVFTGKVVLEGICARTVISITHGDLGLLPRGSFARSWTDSTTGVTYENVFMLGNSCQIQSTLRAGDEFFFIVHDQPDNSCITCMAWSPAPAEKLAIKIVN